MTATRTAALPNVPLEAGTVDTARVRTAKGATVGVVRLSTWHPTLVPTLAAAVKAMQSSDGLVLDLRGNTGGVAQMFPWLAGFVLPPATRLGLFRFRDRVHPLCAAPQAGAVYAGPLVVLVDGHSHSTSEMFAASLQSLGRAQIFGDTTFGGVVGAQYDRLPNGDVLEHAVVDFETSTGDHPEGRGVIPDQVVPLRGDDLRRGTDRVLLAAREWIDAERNRSADEKRHTSMALAKCAL
ncbi:MAG: S41 family peptidase [Longimicrobiales bacterium]